MRTSNKGTIILIDEDQRDFLEQWKWREGGNGAERRGWNKGPITIYMHRLIWEKVYGAIPEDKVIDHIDQNNLNNKLSNLRLATKSQNMMNSNKTRGNVEIRGIHQRKNGKYEAYLFKNGKKIGKTFDKLEDAIEHRKILEINYANRT